MASNRIVRISEEVLRALAETIRLVKDPRVQNGLVSITHCEVTGDLRYAKVFVSVLGTPEQGAEVMQGLKSASGWLRREVGQRVQLRYAPELIFHLDASMTHGAHITKVIHDLEREGKMGTEDDET